jgi:hypothetical protein
VHPTFTPTNDDIAVIADICHRVDGLPLAIELAAARIKLLTPHGLLTQLSDRLRLLTGGPRDLPERQRTMRDAIAWSHDLLDEDDQALFARLALFVGGFDLNSAIAVAGGDPVDVLDRIGALVDQSLLQHVQHDLLDERFMMLETVREFALESLRTYDWADTAHQAHAAYYYDLARRAFDRMYESDARHWLDTLEVEYPNCRAALDYFVASRDATSELWLASLMAEFWQNRGRHSEGIACLSAALERGHEAAPIVRAKAMSELALQVREVGDCGRALQLSAAAERLARTAYDERLACTTFDECLDRTTWDEGLLAQLLFVRAWNIAYCLEAWSEVVPLLEEALERILVTDPDSPLRPAILSDLGWALTRLSEVAPGRQMIEDALDFARVYSQPWAVSKNLMTLGYLDQEAGNAVIAADHYRESLEMLREIRFTLPTIYPLAGLAGLTSDRGNLEWTARLFGGFAYTPA